MRSFPTSPIELLFSFWRNRRLIWELTKRETLGRYKGALLGISWSIIHPILMLLMYTFVFSVVFQAKWGLGTGERKVDFAILLFVGLTIFGLFSSCINRAPLIILSQANYVKKVVFPLEILPWVSLFTALFDASISLGILLTVQLLVNHFVPLTVLLLPLVLLPLLFGVMGISWFLAALGVYIRDISQVTGLATTILMFFSAVFFPLSKVPEKYLFWMYLNPMAVIIEQSREVLVFRKVPDIQHWTILLLLSLGIAWAGFAWFQRVRKGFADVI